MKRITTRPEAWWPELKPSLENFLGQLRATEELRRAEPRHITTPAEIVSELQAHGANLSDSDVAELERAAASHVRRDLKFWSAEEFRGVYKKLLRLGGRIVSPPFVDFGSDMDQPSFWLRFKPVAMGEPKMNVCYQVIGFNDRTKAALTSHGRRLWDADRAQPCAEFMTAQYATSLLHRLLALPIQTGVATEAVRDIPPLHEVIETLRALIAALSDKKASARYNAAFKIANSLEEELSSPAAVRRDNRSAFLSLERHDSEALKEAVIELAQTYQRPPTQAEVREHVKWPNNRRNEFPRGLADAGLRWLLTTAELRKRGSSGLV